MSDLLTYVTSLNLRVTSDKGEDRIRNEVYIKPCSKAHSYRVKKIAEQRAQKSITENADVITKRVSSGQLVPYVEELKLHSSRKSYDFQWCHSSNAPREGVSHSNSFLLGLLPQKISALFRYLSQPLLLKW